MVGRFGVLVVVVMLLSQVVISVGLVFSVCCVVSVGDVLLLSMLVIIWFLMLIENVICWNSCVRFVYWLVNLECVIVLIVVLLQFGLKYVLLFDRYVRWNFVFIRCGFYVRNMIQCLLCIVCLICVSMLVLFDLMSDQFVDLSVWLDSICLMFWFVGVLGLILQILLLKWFVQCVRLVNVCMLVVVIQLGIVSVNFVLFRFVCSMLIDFLLMNGFMSGVWVGIQLLRNMFICFFFNFWYVIGIDRFVMFC